MRFAHINAPLPDANLYILPCVGGYEFFEAFRFDELMKKVNDGATLFVSLDDPYINAYEKYFGATLLAKYNRNKTVSFSVNGNTFEIAGDASVELEATTAEVIARDAEGLPVLLKNRYGEGTVYLLTCPLEKHISTISNASEDYDFYKLYSLFTPNKEVSSNSKYVAVTKHDDIYVAINYSAELIENPINSSLKITEQIYGDIKALKPYDMCVFRY